MDKIADMLTRIRNAQMALREELLVPYSKMGYETAKILQKEGFLKKVQKLGQKNKKKIKITLKPAQKENPAIRGLKKISKQGQRIYKRAQDIKPVRGGYGMAVVSTSQGLMTDKEARKRGVGGEVICEVW